MDTGAMERREDLFQFFRESETPGRHSPAYCYLKVSYTAFREITALRGEGFSMAAICRGLEKSGLLPENASASSFRRAFRRELARRERIARRVSEEEHSVVNGKEPVTPLKPSPKPTVPDEGKKSSGEDAGRLRQLTGSDVRTGSGSIRKLPSGEFEF